jgi:DNA-binding transcriptional LysR family regulator
VELRQLQYFVTVAETRDVNQAAERLLVTAQAVSEEITELEALLGVMLFLRSPGAAVTLTAEGERLLPSARTTISTADEFRRLATSMSSRLPRRLRLGVAPFTLTAPALSLLTRFRRRHPEVHVELRQFSWLDPSAGVLSGESDVGLVRIPFAAHVRLRHLAVHSEPVAAVVAARHPLAAESRVSVRRLTQERFVEPAGVRDPVFALRWYLRGARARDAPENVATAAESVEEWLDDIAAGHGIALLPEGAATEIHRQELAVVPVDGMPLSRLVLAWDPARSGPAGDDFATVASA